MSRNLFDNFNLLVLESGELTRSEIQRLEPIFKKHDVAYKVMPIEAHIDTNDFIRSGFTHIISNSVVFDVYPFTQEKLIPVASTKLIYATVEKGKIQPIRQYSPDPKHVLKDVHICCGGLPVADKEAIYGGVRALGGTFSEMLNKYVTHVISVDPDEDIVVAVEAIKDLNIKAVVPLWVDHCLKLRKKLDESPYMLNRKLLGDPTEKILELDVVKSNVRAPSSQSDFLESKQFYLGKDLAQTQSAADLVSSMIRNSGGVVVKTLAECKFYVGQYRDGEEYITASKSKLYVGNLNWIYWMVEHQKWISPYHKLLHYPYVRGGLPPMQDFIIAASNYSGDARFYIRRLIEALGARFTSNMTSKNTHLITSQGVGKKFQAAHSWKLTTVNHLWLEECYSNWKIRPTTHPRYSVTIGGSVKLEEIVGETPLDVDVLKQFYEDGYTPNTTNIVEDSEDEAELSISKNSQPVFQVPETLNEEPAETVRTLKPATQDSVKSIPNVLTPVKASTSNAAKGLIDALSPVVRSSSRKAKDKAALALHANAEDMNLFEKQKGRVLLPEEIEERKRQREEKKEKSHKSANPLKKVKVEPSKRYHIEAIATGWEVEFNRADLQLLHSLGISINKEFKKGINAIIAPKLMRTEKFLIGLSYPLKHIVSPEFVKQVIQLSKSESPLPEPEEYAIDPQLVAELTTLSLSELTNRCHKESNNKGLFHNMSLNITAKLPGGATTVQKILKAHGCKEVKVIKTMKEMKSMKVFKSGEQTMLISNENGMNDRFKQLCEEENTKGKIVEWDWVITSLFTMALNGDAHVVYKS